MPEKLEGDQLEFRNLLMEQKRRLWGELMDDIFRQRGVDLATQYDIPKDPGEQSLLDVLSDAGLAIADVRKDQLTQLEGAQRRLEMGTYGICEECGEPIGLERLRVMPFTPYCIECQKGKEGEEGPPKGSGVTL